MSESKQNRIHSDDQATSRMYTELEYEALMKENAQLKQTVEGHCARERESITEKKALDDINQLLVTGKWSDVTITVGGKNFAVHRTILSARSSILADLLEKNCKKNCLVISDVDVDIFEILLSFIYTGKVPALKPKMAQGLLAVADKYRLEELCGQLSLESVVNLHLFANVAKASKLKDKCLELLNSDAGSSINRCPVASLHDPCLLALFKQLPPADQLTARKVCRRWADLVTYAARSTRSLTILLGDRAMHEFQDSVNSYSLGSIKVVSLLQKEDGSPMFPLARFSQWNTLLYRGEGLDEATVEAIAATFININTLQIGLIDASSSQLDFISRLLELLAHQLTTLKIREELDLQYPFANRLFAAINGISTLKHLHLHLSELYDHDLPVISQLEQLNVYWDCITPQEFVAMLRQHATVNIPLRHIEYLYDNDNDAVIEQFTSLDDHLLSRFTRFANFIPEYPFTNSELICAHFRHLTSLNIRPTATTLRRLFGHLSQLTQLLYLRLDIDFASILPDDQSHLLLPQLNSVKALKLDLTILAHHDLEQLKIGWTMSNVEAIDVYFYWWSQCTDCTIEGFTYHLFEANLVTAKDCYRQMFAPLKRTCTQLRAILHNREDILGSADELLAE